MKKFIIKVLLFVVLVLFAIMVVSLEIVLPTSTRSSFSYLFAGKQKDFLLETTKSPRIIFVGGSNLAYGLDSQMIKDSIGLNPVNTGLTANLGLKYMLDNTYQYIKEGDIVIVAAEYEHFYRDYDYGSKELLVTFLKVDKSKIRLMSIRQIKNSLLYYTILITTRLRDTIFPRVEEEKLIYGLNRFNEYGDHYTHWDLDVRDFLPYKEPYINDYNPKIIEKLKEFEERIRLKGAVLYVSYPSMQDISFDNYIEVINKIEDEFIRHGFTLLGTPGRYRMDTSLMFDSPYHPNGTGVVLRTELLTEDLREAGVGN